MKFCAEIQYDTPEGMVHSDICYCCGKKDDAPPPDNDYRQFLHDNLDEWLDKSNGTGHFVVGDWWSEFEDEMDRLRQEVWNLRKQLKNS